MLIASILGILLALTTAAWVVRSVRQPIHAISNSLAGIIADEQVNLDVVFDAHNRDEFGRLGHAMNSLLASITDTVSRISEASEKLEQQSMSIRGGSSDLSMVASRQAASVQEVSAAVIEMSSSMQDNDGNVQQANSMAQAASAAAERGDAATVELATAMAKMRESSEEIAKVLGAIDGIAFQTNLLALNAAVEAARAGEAGKGFAVVAEEVRSLAHRSAEEARSTRQLLDDSLANVQGSVEQSSQVTSVFSEIDECIRGVTETLERVVCASSEQSKGLSVISSVSDQVDQASQATAAQSEELSAAASSSTEAAIQLRTMIRRFAT